MFGGIPFEHFAQAAGGGGGMPGRGPREEVDTTKLYETLEVSKDASLKDIKKAFHRLSKIHHPDKGGDGHKFKEINAAYEILSDEEKRKTYDKYGLEGVADDSGGGGPGADDLFSMFFGGGRRGRGGGDGPRKGPNVQHPLRVSLQDLYMGKTVKLAVNRKVIDGEAKTCPKCKGSGVVMEVRQLGPGMITQVQRQCDMCGGMGYIAETKNERKVLEVRVDPGMKHGEKIVFREMADEMPNMEPGDINFVIQEKDHDEFKRKGADLLITKEVSLNQALCGLKWKLEHLDGRELLIKTKPGEIIKAEMNTSEPLPFVKVVPEEGMPSRGNPFVKGNLYILFRVKFPEDGELGEDQIKKLREVLPEPDMEVEYDPEKVEEVYMSHSDLRQFGKGGASSTDEAYDEDDERGGQAVQCQQS